MPLAEEPLALAAALRDPQVVLRYQAKMVTVPGSDCLWWRGAVSGRGHGRFYVGRVAAAFDVSGTAGGREDREVCVIAHRFGYALVHGAGALNAAPVLGHGCDNPLVRREALADRVEVRDLHRRPVAAGRLKLGAA